MWHVVPIPDKQYYDPDLMKPKQGKDFSKKVTTFANGTMKK